MEAFSAAVAGLKGNEGTGPGGKGQFKQVEVAASMAETRAGVHAGEA